MKLKQPVSYFMILLFVINFAKAQTVSVELPRENIVIRGILNPLRIVAENTSCDDVLVKSPDSKLDRSEGCKYSLVTTSSNNSVSLNIYKIVKKDTLLLEKKYLRVIDLPNPITTINGHEGGAIAENAFKTSFAMGKFGCYSQYIDIPCSITECTMIVLRGEECIGVSKNIGNRVTDQTKDIMKLIKSGDDVYFVNFKCKTSLDNLELNDIKFKVK